MLQYIKNYYVNHKFIDISMLLIISLIIGILTTLDNVGILLLVFLSFCMILVNIMFVFKKKPTYFIFSFFLTVTFLNFLYLIFSKLISIEQAAIYKTVYVISREGLFYILLIILLIKNFRHINLLLKRSWTDKLAMCFLVIGVIYLILPIGYMSFSLKLGSFKQIYNCVILYFIGRFFLLGCSDKNFDIDTVSKFIVKLGLLISIYGICEVYIIPYILGNDTLISMGGSEYFSLMFGADASIYGGGVIQTSGLPGNFYFGDLSFASFRRVSSILVDPVALGFYLSFPLVLSLIFTRFKYLVSGIIYVCSVLAFGKGGWITSLCGVVPWVLRKNKIVGIPLLIIVLLFGIGVIVPDLLRPGTSVNMHILGLVDNISKLPSFPIGRGLGSSGNLALLVNGGNNQSSLDMDIGAGESSIGSIAGQMGIPGLILFTVFVFGLIRCLRDLKFKSTKTILLTKCLKGLLFGGYFSSFLSEGVFQFNALGGLTFFIGLLLSYYDREYNSKRVIGD